MPESGTVAKRRELYADRWSTLGEAAGITELSEMLEPEELARYPIFEDLDASFLAELSPDISVARWEADVVLFEEGSYLDLAFWLEEGEVEMFVAGAEEAGQPIFTTTLTEAFPASEHGDETQPLSGAVRPRPPEGWDGSTITFLSSMEFDLFRGERLRLGRGEFFGEISALNGWPQSVTARTVTPCTVVQIRLPALRKLRRKSKALKARLDEIYRRRTLRNHLSRTPLLRECDDRAIKELARNVELVSCEPGEVVTEEGGRAEHLILVRSGFLKLSQRMGAGEVVVSYLSKGTTLGDVELLVDGIEGWQVTASSVGYSELVRIARTDFEAVLEKQPSLKRRMWEMAVDQIKEMGFTRQHLARSDLVEFSLAKGLVQGNSVLVIDLETCTRCDDCVRGCAETHGGIPRFVREGEKYQSFLVARSCYHCQDPVCLIGCPTGAIRRANVGDVVEIDPSICIGCSACAQNCPYDAIVMHDTGETWGEDAVPAYLRGQPRSMATKCDLCYTSPQGPACEASCPHDCAFRISSLDEFDALIEAKSARKQQT